MGQGGEFPDMSHVLGPCEGPVYRTGRATLRSGLSNGLVRAFLASGVSAAAVRHELTPYGPDELYQGLRNACRKKGLRNVVAVRKAAGRLYLRRIDGR